MSEIDPYNHLRYNSFIESSKRTLYTKLQKKGKLEPTLVSYNTVKNRVTLDMCLHRDIEARGPYNEGTTNFNNSSGGVGQRESALITKDYLFPQTGYFYNGKLRPPSDGNTPTLSITTRNEKLLEYYISPIHEEKEEKEEKRQYLNRESDDPNYKTYKYKFNGPDNFYSVTIGDHNYHHTDGVLEKNQNTGYTIEHNYTIKIPAITSQGIAERIEERKDYMIYEGGQISDVYISAGKQKFEFSVGSGILLYASSEFYSGGYEDGQLPTGIGDTKYITGINNDYVYSDVPEFLLQTEKVDDFCSLLREALIVTKEIYEEEYDPSSGCLQSATIHHHKAHLDFKTSVVLHDETTTFGSSFTPYSQADYDEFILKDLIYMNILFNYEPPNPE